MFFDFQILRTSGSSCVVSTVSTYSSFNTLLWIGCYSVIFGTGIFQFILFNDHLVIFLILIHVLITYSLNKISEFGIQSTLQGLCHYISPHILCWTISYHYLLLLDHVSYEKPSNCNMSGCLSSRHTSILF